MKVTRREFIQMSGLASTAMFIPGFLKGMEQGAGLNGISGKKRRLVVVQLSGGNDGLNTIVPFRDDAYYRARPDIAINANNVLRMNDDLGFNSVMTHMKSIYDAGYMTIINNVGYPNPSKSHFRSMDIWHTATDSDKYASSGWIGNYLDATCGGCDQPYRAIEMDGTLSLSMKGKTVNGIAVQNPALLYKTVSEPWVKSLAAKAKPKNPGHDQVDYLYKTLIETVSSADYIYQHSKIFKSNTIYPGGEVAGRLKTIAELIISDIDTSVFYISSGGFDTHISQKGSHNNLLRGVSAALGAFVKDLNDNGRLEDTMIMVFSEFGRRVAQNGSKGTDHGTANNLYIINKNLKKPGFFNEMPDLKNLDDGDLKYTVDFRRIYAELIDDWLGADSGKILNGKYSKLGFI